MGLGIRLVTSLLFLFLLSTTSSAASSRHYYIVVYGHQGAVNLPKDSHSFASFYTERDIDKFNDFTYPAPTISWLPATMKIKPLQIQEGFNFSLAQTMDNALDKGYRWEQFGPFEVTEALYERAMNRIELLKHPLAYYQMFGDPKGPNLKDEPGRQTNCIAALGDITGICRTGGKFGIPASKIIVECLQPHIIH